MSSVILGLLAETSLHPGTETSGGVVDLPVAREATTSYPVLMGSGLKGALRDAFEHNVDKSAKTDAIFGRPDWAGNFSVTDGRLLLLPVRSLTGNYRWVTCPYILERFQRDLELAKKKVSLEKIFQPDQAHAVAAASGNIYLEELSFTAAESREKIESVVDAIRPLIYHQSVQDRLLNQLVIVNDDEFKSFASYGLPVNARNVLDKEKKTSKNLWYEETIPTDTLFYTILIPRKGNEDQLEELKQMFASYSYLQVGGNETIGQGWCAVSWWDEGAE